MVLARGKTAESLHVLLGGLAGRLQTHFSLYCRSLQIRLRAMAHLLLKEQRQDCSIFPKRRFRRTGFLQTPASTLGDFFFFATLYPLLSPLWISLCCLRANS